MDFTPALIAQAPLAAGAIFVIWLLLSGRVHSHAEFQHVEAERDALQKALETERRTTNELAEAGTVTNRLIEAVVTLAADRKGIPVITGTVRTPEDPAP